MLADIETAVSVRYVVKLDDQELGEFSSCEGLGIEVVMETREEVATTPRSGSCPPG